MTTSIYIGRLVSLSSRRSAQLLDSLSTLAPTTTEHAVLKQLSTLKDARAMVNLVCCLGCGFNEKFAVGVLDAIAGLLEEEEVPEWRVAREQWGRLLRICGGIFEESVFRGNVERILERGLWSIGKAPSKVELPLRVVNMESAQTLAMALVEMGRVLNGERRVVHVTGIDLCGWITVWAEEVLGLRVEVYDQEGDLIRRSFEERHGEVQVTVRFVKVQGLSTSMLSVVVKD